MKFFPHIASTPWISPSSSNFQTQWVKLVFCLLQKYFLAEHLHSLQQSYFQLEKFTGLIKEGIFKKCIKNIEERHFVVSQPSFKSYNLKILIYFMAFKFKFIFKSKSIIEKKKSKMHPIFFANYSINNFT